MSEEVKNLVDALVAGEDYSKAFDKAWNNVLANKLEELQKKVSANFFDVPESVEEGFGGGGRASALSGPTFRSTRSYSSKLADERADLSKPKVQAPVKKIYHNVPFADKDKAKSEGMRFDGDKKKWYHTSTEASNKSSFPKLNESEELDYEIDEAVDPKIAHDILTKHGVLGKDFFQGDTDHHNSMVELSKKYKIRAGSTGKSAARAMHDHLNRQAAKYKE